MYQIRRQAPHFQRVATLIDCILNDDYKMGLCNRWINDSLYGYDVSNFIMGRKEFKEQLQELKTICEKEMKKNGQQYE